jgi:hypothetical protein
MSSKLESLIADLPKLLRIPSVAKSRAKMSDADAANARSVTFTLSKAAGIPISRDALDSIKRDCEYVVIRPDSPITLTEFNAALGNHRYRPSSGFDDGRMLDLAAYAEDFTRYGAPDLAKNLTVQNLAESLREFKRGRVSLRVALYDASGKPDYRHPIIGQLAIAIVKLTVSDGVLTFPADATARTSGNAYAIILPQVKTATARATEKIRERVKTLETAKAKRAAKSKTREPQAAAAKSKTREPQAAAAKSKRAKREASKKARDAKRAAERETVTAATAEPIETAQNDLLSVVETALAVGRAEELAEYGPEE